MALSVEDYAVLSVGVIAAGFLVFFGVCHGIIFSIRRKYSREPSEKPISARTLVHLTRARMFFAVATSIFIQLTFLALVMFDMLPIAAGIILSFLVGASTYIYYVPHVPEGYEPKIPITRKRDILAGKFKYHPWAMGIGLFVILAITLVLNIILEGTCSDNLAIIDTRILRRYKSSSCPSGTPCHVFITLPQDPSTAVIINHHTSPPGSGPNKSGHFDTIVYYDTVSRSNVSDYRFSANGNSFRMPHLEVTRDVHWTHLTGLTPNTTYYFVAGPGYDDSGNEYWTAERKFRTVFNESEDFTFVAGGDMDSTHVTSALSVLAASEEPLFGLVGGDIAYEYGQYTCYRRVDNWIKIWMDKMVTPSGYTVPLITTIGNHEVHANFGAKRSQVPFYIRYFPHMSKDEDPGSSLAQVDSRLTYHLHLLGKQAVIYCMDSDHVEDPFGRQADWLASSMEQYKWVPFQYATYHVPMYPSHRAYSISNSVKVRDAWQYLFDEYNLTVAFENHDHIYKRSKILKYGQENPYGTLYMGDGCWGIGNRGLPSGSLRWYLDASYNLQFFLKTQVTLNTMNFSAIDDQGEVFDTYHLQL